MLKINTLDAHDRYIDFTKKSFSIEECVEEIVNQRPFGNIPFYIFAHPRTHEDGANKRLIWQPRLTKPKAQTNSMLFKAYPGSDNIKIIWMIPDRTLWPQYQKGNVTDSKIVRESVLCFIMNRSKLEMPEADDLSDEQIHQVYKELSAEAKRKKMMQKVYPITQENGEAFSTS